MRIGFLGMGNMGRPMALRLIAAGHELSVWNRSEGLTKPLIHEGAVAAGTPAETELGADAVITMLFDDGAYEQVVFGPNGLADALSPGGLHISCSTIGVGMSERIALEYAKRDIDFVGAPVFGGPTEATKGQLWVVAAGAEKAIHRARPLLSALSRGITVVGKEPRQAYAVRLAGSFLLGAMMHSLSEALVFAAHQGVEPEIFSEAANQALFQSPGFAGCVDRILHAPEHEGPSLEVGAKDLRLFRSALGRRQPHLSLVEPMAAMYAEARRMGLADEDAGLAQYRVAQRSAVEEA